jgi:PAS domain S-box-containing protein
MSAVALWSVQWGIAAAAAVGGTLALGFWMLTARPLGSLVAAARRIQADDLNSPVPLAGAREFRDLGRALEEMRRAILASREELVGQNKDLATRAEASSAGLSAVTQELAVMHTVVTESVQAPADSPRVATEQLTRLHWVDAACVALLDRDGRLTIAAESGFRPGAAAATLDVVQHELATQAFADGAFVEDARRTDATRILQSQGVRALAAVPIPGQGVAEGVVVVAREEPMRFEESRRSLLRAVSSELTAAVELFELADEAEESRRLAETVLREMQDGAVVIDSAGRCQMCNPAAAKLLRVEREEIIGLPALDWIPIPTHVFERLRRRVQEGEDASRPFIVEHERRLLAFSAGLLPDHDPGRGGLILMIRDVTDAVSAERMKQEFVSMVGHELRTPLTLIRTSVDLLAEEDAGSLSPTQARITEVLRNNSDRLLSLINDLLDMSAIDSGRLVVHPSEVELGELIGEVFEGYGHEAEVRDLVFTLEVPRAGVPAWADRPRLSQVISNLVGNAVKYTPHGGHVIVRARSGEGVSRVEVQDDGIGIPPEEQPQLFERFYRTTAGQRQSGGTGLGLAIARSIVELHGGEIWCESDGKSGTTFIFTVPSRPPAGATFSA